MESALYGIYALVVFVSEIERVRFLIREQLVRKYRTPVLSMKYSLYPHGICFRGLHNIEKIVLRWNEYSFFSLIWDQIK